jgi:ribosome biogenesis protein ENP2
MASMKVHTLNDVNIYNLTSGKTLPQWAAEKNRRALAKDEGFRRRIELLQDLDFPTASKTIKCSADGNYVVASGSYKPAIKIFDVHQLSMKVCRALNTEVVDFTILSEDYGKMAALMADRSIVFHAPYGEHYAVRVPKFGRCMAYHPSTCDLFVGGSAAEVWRLNLEQGRFLSALPSGSPGTNAMHVNPLHKLLGCAGEDGVVECWDTRAKKSTGRLDIETALGAALGEDVGKGGRAGIGGGIRGGVRGFECTSIKFAEDGLTMAVGTSSGHALLFDVRSSRPSLVKAHQYGLPVIDVQFHRPSGNVLSSDAKVIKIWDQRSGEVFTNIEPEADLNGVCVVQDARGASGLILCAAEQERCPAYYVPQLGHAPKWCAFLDSITDELEESRGDAGVYESYKFVTRQELEALGLAHLVGSPLLRAYMHGFFMDQALYARSKAVAAPFEFAAWRKKQKADKIEEKRANRIAIRRRAPKVNAKFAGRVGGTGPGPGPGAEGGGEGEGEGEGGGGGGGAAGTSNPLGDDRFGAMFKDSAFEVDEDDDEFHRINPSGLSGKRQMAKQYGDDMDSDEDLEDNGAGGGGSSGGGGGGGGGGVDPRFARVVAEEEEEEGRPDDAESSEDEFARGSGGGGRRAMFEAERAAKTAKKAEREARKAANLKKKAKAQKKGQMYELRDGEAAPQGVGFSGVVSEGEAQARKRQKLATLAERLEARAAEIKSKEAEAVTYLNYGRTMKFEPARRDRDGDEGGTSEERHRRGSRQVGEDGWHQEGGGKGKGKGGKGGKGKGGKGKGKGGGRGKGGKGKGGRGGGKGKGRR